MSDPAGRPIPFAAFHVEFWDWVWAIRRGSRPRPFVAIWPRGCGKSTSIELALTAVGARQARRYGLYICSTQERADSHVQNVAGMLENPLIAAAYPDLAERRIGKYGNSQGWRRNRLRTASGFTLDAIGLDVAARGAKVDEDRPDFLILDDIDEGEDSVTTTEKKIRTITRALLPAGSTDAAVVAVQNLIHPDSIFAQLADGRADFLTDRIVSGPHPAIRDLTYRQTATGYEILTGSPTWAGKGIQTCREEISQYGLTAFLAECQHEVSDPLGGMYDNVEFKRIAREQLPSLVTVECWVDPAVTAKDSSDANGIQIDGLDRDGTIYRLYSWEQRSSPLETLKLAIRKAVEYGATVVGVETDQGGDTWQSVWREAVRAVFEEPWSGDRPDRIVVPRFREQKAGSSQESKTHRGAQMLADYERGRIVHVEGPHVALEKALRRFPKTKPYDLHDAAYWAWHSLRESYRPVRKPRQDFRFGGR